MDALGRMAAIIVAVILLVFFPIRYEAKKTEISVNSFVITEMELFINHIQNSSRITDTMYYDFCNRLAATGDSFLVEIESYKKCYYMDQDVPVCGMEYEDVTVWLNEHEAMELTDHDYILLRVTRKSKAGYEYLKNLFLPTFSTKSVFQMGGGIH